MTNDYVSMIVTLEIQQNTPAKHIFLQMMDKISISKLENSYSDWRTS